MYGLQIQTMQDKYVLLSRKAVEGISIARVAGAFWVEHFPILQYLPAWFPGSSARRMADIYRPFAVATRNELYEKVKQDVVGWIQCPSEAMKHLSWLCCY